MTDKKQLSRRTFMKSTVVASSAATASLAAPAVIAQSPIVISMQTSWQETDIWMDFAREYVTRVELMSGGRITFDLQPGGKSVEPSRVIDAVSDGVLDAAHSLPVFWYNKHKAAALFGSGPFWGGSPSAMFSWFYQGGGIDLYNELTQDILSLQVYGFLGFPMFAQPFGWFRDEVESMADLSGFKFRADELAADLMQYMGMSVTQMSVGEIVSAMSRGEIDGFEHNNPTTDSNFGAQEIAKNYYLSSFHQAMESFEFLFNKDFYDNLDTDLQAILRFSVESATASNTASALRNYSSDLNKLEKEHEVSVHRTPKEILEGQLQAWDELIQDLSFDEFSSRVIKSQQEWVEQVAYFDLTNAPNSKLAYDYFFPDKLNF